MTKCKSYFSVGLETAAFAKKPWYTEFKAEISLHSWTKPSAASIWFLEKTYRLTSSKIFDPSFPPSQALENNEIKPKVRKKVRLTIENYEIESRENNPWNQNPVFGKEKQNWWHCNHNEQKINYQLSILRIERNNYYKFYKHSKNKGILRTIICQSMWLLWWNGEVP